MGSIRYYRPELDVLRLVAFSSVFLVHRMDFLPIRPAEHYWLYNLCLFLGLKKRFTFVPSRDSG